jgi:hypothetical protein
VLRSIELESYHRAACEVFVEGGSRRFKPCESIERVAIGT